MFHRLAIRTFLLWRFLQYLGTRYHMCRLLLSVKPENYYISELTSLVTLVNMLINPVLQISRDTKVLCWDNAKGSFKHFFFHVLVIYLHIIWLCYKITHSEISFMFLNEVVYIMFPTPNKNWNSFGCHFLK